jgi:hypothetical protein
MAPTAKKAALFYYLHGPFRVYELPDEIGSHRGPQFVSGFTEELSKILGIKWKLFSSGHSQSAGQAEIMNKYLDQRLRPWLTTIKAIGPTSCQPWTSRSSRYHTIHWIDSHYLRC